MEGSDESCKLQSLFPVFTVEAHVRTASCSVDMCMRTDCKPMKELLLIRSMGLGQQTLACILLALNSLGDRQIGLGYAARALLTLLNTRN